MTTSNALQKKIIKAFANAPAAALRELLRGTSDQNEQEQIKRIASALGVTLQNSTADTSPAFPCRNCLYFAVCGDNMRREPCDGRKTKRENKNQ